MPHHFCHFNRIQNLFIKIHAFSFLSCSKSFDTEMCSLPFPVDKMYHFVLERFEGTTAAVQDQNLQWLQVNDEKCT